MDRWDTPPERAASPTWGPPPPCKQALRLAKTTTLHVDHAFLYISLLSLHDYDMKMPNFVEDVSTGQRLYFSFLEPRYSLLEFNYRKNCQHLAN